MPICTRNIYLVQVEAARSPLLQALECKCLLEHISDFETELHLADGWSAITAVVRNCIVGCLPTPCEPMQSCAVTPRDLGSSQTV